MQRRISIECLTSRVPALFAYYEWNEYGEAIKTNAFIGEDGCYGKVVCDIELPSTMNTAIEGIEAGGIYTYSTLVSLYYQYRDEYKDDLFIIFMETAIGKIDIDIDDFEKDQDLVPSHVYLGNARRLLDWYVNRKTLCDRYSEAELFNKDICCKCEEYYRSGGDTMLEKLRDMVDRAKAVADEYFNYAVDGKKGITFSVDLDCTIDDLGLDSPYLNEWIGGRSYGVGEIITYGENGIYHSYEVKKPITGVDSYNTETEKYEFSKLIEGRFVECNESNGSKSAEATKVFRSESKLRTLRKFTGNMYDYTESEEPGDEEDWLLYYCPGYITDYTSLNDDYGNIRTFSGDIETIEVDDKTIVTNLYLYGSAIKTVTINPEDRKIIFEYYINTHLYATLGGITIGDDGVTKYYYEDMFIGEEPCGEGQEKCVKSGVRYIDVYTYEEGGEIDEKMNGVTGEISFDNPDEFYDFFKEEIIDDKGTEDTSDDEQIENNEIIYTRYAFLTKGRQTSCTTLINGQEMYSSYIWAEGERTNDRKADMFNVPVFKRDYYYGAAYAPEREIDVRIARGNASAFERHIRLSEVKTMEDLENYANGGYYSIADLTS